MNRLICKSLLVGALCSAALPLLAQTTGQVVIEAADSAGEPALGAMVTVSSPSLQGARSSRSDARGEVHFPFLPPGTYRVESELAGFKPVPTPYLP